MPQSNVPEVRAPAAASGAEESRSLLRGAGAFGALTAVSRAAGLLRDVALTWVLSAAARDAFVFAFSLPMMFRNLFGEGALTNSFVPIYVNRLEKGERDGANRLASLVFTALTALLCALAALGAAGCLAARYLPGISERAGLILKLLAVMSPFLPLVCLYAFFLAILTSHRRFAVPGAAPILLNLAILAGAWLAWKRWGPGSDGGVWFLAVAVIVGGGLQLALELPVAWRSGLRIRPALDFKDRDFRGVLAAMAPVLVGTGVFQLNTFLNRTFALTLVPGSGAQSYLAFANLLVMAPMGVIAVAMSTAALPVLSALHARKDREAFGQTLIGAARVSLFMIAPVIVVFTVSGEPIVRLLYERGGWRPDETPMMGRVLFWSSLGLAPTVVTMLCARAFYAMKRPSVPARIAVISVAVNVALSLLLVRSGGFWGGRTLAGSGLVRWLGGPEAAAGWFSGAAGLALACALAALIQSLQMLWALRREVPGLRMEPLGWSALRTLGLCAVVAVVVNWVKLSLPPEGEGFMVVLQRGVAPPVAGALAYWLAASLVDAQEYRELWKTLRRRKKTADDAGSGGKQAKSGGEDSDDDDEDDDDGEQEGK